MSYSRWRTLAGVSLAVLGVTAASAQAADPTDMVQELRVGISPSRAGTKRKPQPAAINVTINSPTENPAATKTVDVYFGKGLAFNNRLFPTCSTATINRTQSVSGCPRGSIVGKGRARATGYTAGTKVPETLSVTAVNGASNQLHLFVKGTVPIAISGPLTGKLSRASGPYGYKLAVKIPENLRNVAPGQIYAALSFFTVRVKATTKLRDGRSVDYVTTTGCPKGGWPFRANFAFDPNAPFFDDPLTAESPKAKCS